MEEKGETLVKLSMQAFNYFIEILIIILIFVNKDNTNCLYKNSR